MPIPTHRGADFMDATPFRKSHLEEKKKNI